MPVITRLPDGAPVVIAVGEELRRWLANAVFSMEGPGPGRITKWRSVMGMLESEAVLGKLLRHVQKVIDATLADNAKRHAARAEIEMAFDHPVGWPMAVPRHGTVPFDLATYLREGVFKNRELMESNPFWSAQALMFRTDEVKEPVNPTSTVTIGYRVSFSNEGWLVQVAYLYPGQSFGPPEGKITRRTGMIFFSPRHPCVPL